MAKGLRGNKRISGGCKVLLFRIVSGAIASELAFLAFSNF